MKRDYSYCCSLDIGKCVYDNAFFNSCDEAIEAGKKAIEEYNNFKISDPLVDEDVFAEELVELIDTSNNENKLPPIIKEFYVIKWERPEIPFNCGEEIVDTIDEMYWYDINYLFEKDTLKETLGENKIMELNKIIFDFIDENTNDYEFMTFVDYRKIRC